MFISIRRGQRLIDLRMLLSYQKARRLYPRLLPHLDQAIANNWRSVFHREVTLGKCDRLCDLDYSIISMATDGR
jgi:hypothetical protein